MILAAIEKQGIEEYRRQGLDLALIVDQNVDNPRDLHGVTGLLPGKLVFNRAGPVISAFLENIELDPLHDANYETEFLLKHIEKNPDALFQAASWCASNPESCFLFHP